VEFPAGVYLVGNIMLRDHVTLRLQRGCVLKGSDDLDDYQVSWAYMIAARGARDIGIVGEGTIHCNQRAFYTKREEAKKRGVDQCEAVYEKMCSMWGKSVVSYWGVRPWRPRATLYLFKCEDVVIRGVRFVEGAVTTINMTGCESVTLDGISIENDDSILCADGINIVASRNVFIVNSHLASEDDPVCIYHSLPCLDNRFTEVDGDLIWYMRNGVPAWEEVTEAERDRILEESDQLTDAEFAKLPTENVVVSNCILETRQNGFRINGGMPGAIRNINISDCVITGAAIPFNIKMFYQCSSGLAKYPGSTAIENISISNITATGIGLFPLLIRNEGPPGQTAGHIRNVFLRNACFECSGEWNGCGIYIGGHRERNVENIHLSDVDILVGPRSQEESTQEGRYPNLAGYEQTPEERRQHPGYSKPPYAVYCRYVTGLSLRDVGIRFREGVEEYPALRLDHVVRPRLRSVEAPEAAGNPVVFRDVQDPVIHLCPEHIGRAQETGRTSSEGAGPRRYPQPQESMQEQGDASEE
jgi:hypothetical protein